MNKVVLLTPQYWRLFTIKGAKFDVATSKLMPNKLDYYDCIFLLVNIIDCHWNFYVIFPKLHEIFELNPIAGISLSDLYGSVLENCMNNS